MKYSNVVKVHKARCLSTGKVYTGYSLGKIKRPKNPSRSIDLVGAQLNTVKWEGDTDD